MDKKINNPTPAEQRLWDEMTPEEQQEWYALHTYAPKFAPEDRWENQLKAMCPEERAEYEKNPPSEVFIAMEETNSCKYRHTSKVFALMDKVAERLEKKTGNIS